MSNYRSLMRYHRLAKVHYAVPFLLEYIAFIQWCRLITCASTDREAFSLVRTHPLLRSSQHELIGWYEVRNKLVHGYEVREGELQKSYKSLREFMAKAIIRLRQRPTQKDGERLRELRILMKHDMTRADMYDQEYTALLAKSISWESFLNET